MKQKVSPQIMAGVIGVVVLILGLIAWKVFVPTSEGGSPDVLKAAKARKSAREGD